MPKRINFGKSGQLLTTYISWLFEQFPKKIKENIKYAPGYVHAMNVDCRFYINSTSYQLIFLKNFGKID